MSLEEQIRTMAEQGYSKQHTMELLGFTRDRFAAVLELLGTVNWPRQGCSQGNKAAHARRRGLFTPGMARSCAKAGEARKAQAQRTVRGVTGTLEELLAHFSLSIHACTVRRRLAAGLSLEQALFIPRCARNNLGEILGAHTLSDQQWAERGRKLRTRENRRRHRSPPDPPLGGQGSQPA